MNVVLPSYREYSSSQRQIVETENKRITMYSSSICCLADIPAVHLGYHATRYGKFAIGFHRRFGGSTRFQSRIIYTLDNRCHRHIYEGLSSIESRHFVEEVVAAAQSIEGEIWNDSDEYSYATVDTSDVVAKAEDMDDMHRRLKPAFEILLRSSRHLNQINSIRYTVNACGGRFKISSSLLTMLQ